MSDKLELFHDHGFCSACDGRNNEITRLKGELAESNRLVSDAELCDVGEYKTIQRLRNDLKKARKRQSHFDRVEKAESALASSRKEVEWLNVKIASYIELVRAASKERDQAQAALEAVILSDLSPEYEYGQPRKRGKDKTPGIGQRWLTPRELARAALRPTPAAETGTNTVKIPFMDTPEEAGKMADELLSKARIICKSRDAVEE